MNFQEVIDFLNNEKSGFITSVATYDTKSNSIMEPVAYDIDKDGSDEVITGTQDGTLLVLKNDGTVLWNYKVSEKVGAVEAMFLDQDVSNSINSTPLVEDINGDSNLEIIFGTELGHVYCLDNKGKKLWDFKADGAIRGKIGLLDIDNNDKPKIVFGTTNKIIYILDVKGKKIKSIETEHVIESTPIMFDGNLIIGTSEGKLVAMKKTGDVKWIVSTEEKITAEPTLFPLKKGVTGLLVGSTDNTLYCINSRGKVLWKYKTEGSIYSKVLIEDLNDDGLPEIIFGSCDNRLYVLNNRGIKLWSYDTDFWIVGSPVIMDIDNDNNKEIVVGSYDTQVYVLSAEGMYGLGFVPGISGIVTQDGNYSEIPTQDPGEIVGKKLWSYQTQGFIVGCCNSSDHLVVQTKDGKIIWIKHEKN